MAYDSLKYGARVIQTVFWKFNSAHYEKRALDTVQLRDALILKFYYFVKIK